MTMHTYTDNAKPGSLLQDPPDISEEDLDEVVRKAFANVSKKNRLAKEKFFQELDRELFEAVQSCGTL